MPIRRTGADSDASSDPERLEADDPRLTGDHVRTLTGHGGSVTLVGAVHDHPSSEYRTGAVVAKQNPDVLGLEVPPLGLPYFRAAAKGGDETAGGEMAAAIAAADTDRVVGIDGPSIRFVCQLASQVARDRPPIGTLSTMLAGITSAGRGALRCHVDALAPGLLGTAREPVGHECASDDAPEVQAADERHQIERARAVTAAFEPTRASRFRDRTREAHMASRIRRLSREGDVVAVVGHDHLDSIATRLRDEY